MIPSYRQDRRLSDHNYHIKTSFARLGNPKPVNPADITDEQIIAAMESISHIKGWKDLIAERMYISE